MSTLIVSNYYNFSEALNRFIHHCKPSDNLCFLSGFQQFESFWINNLNTIETLIIDVYNEVEGKFITSGIINGLLFLTQNKKVVWFYTKGGLIDEISYDQLPPNIFYLPNQLTQFLAWIKVPEFLSYESLQIQKLFKSQPITNYHH